MTFSKRNVKVFVQLSDDLLLLKYSFLRLRTVRTKSIICMIVLKE